MSNPILIKNFIAGAAISAFRFTKFSAADTIIQGAAATDAVIGVSGEIAAAVGERADVTLIGIAFIEAGAAFSQGALLVSDAVGRAIAGAPAAGSNVRVGAIAIDAAVAAGDIVRAIVSQCSLQG